VTEAARLNEPAPQTAPAAVSDSAWHDQARELIGDLFTRSPAVY
jgi:hypothetical protein